MYLKVPEAANVGEVDWRRVGHHMTLVENTILLALNLPVTSIVIYRPLWKYVCKDIKEH